MVLVVFLLTLTLGGMIAWLAGWYSTFWPRVVSLLALGVDLILAIAIWIQAPTGMRWKGDWIYEIDWPWIPFFHIRFHLALDYLSLILLTLVFFLGLLAVTASWREVKERVGFFHFNLLWVLAGVVGVFLAMDLFLFYFFWEFMLAPMYLLIGIWGHGRRIYAAIKFFIFTQVSGLLMLLSFLGLVYANYDQTRHLTYDYMQLLQSARNYEIGSWWIMIGLFIAFTVKLPAVPFHTWLPDAHSQAPTAGSVILAGLLLKTGAYGLIRFPLMLCPMRSLAFANVAMFLGVVGIIYGAALAYAQTDIKRLVAYSSVSHMGFVLLGIYAMNEWGLKGAVLQMICHGLSTGAMFILAGILYERTKTRDIQEMGGLLSVAPKMGGVGLFLALASLGLPGIGNFVAEILVLAGTFQVSIILTVFAAAGLVVVMAYSLRFFQRIFQGDNVQEWKFQDLRVPELVTMAVVIVLLVWLGCYPQPVLDRLDTILVHLDVQRGVIYDP